MDRALEENEGCDFMFLFAHDGVKEFYPRFGFRPVEQSLFTARARAGKTKRVEKLDSANPQHLKLIQGLYEQRAPLSQTLGITDGLSIFMFHCLYTLKGALYLLPDDGVLVAAKVRGEQLNVFDVVSPRPLDLADVLTSGTFPGVTDLVFHFRPDGLDVATEPYEHGGEDILFVRGDFPLAPKTFKFPLTSQT